MGSTSREQREHFTSTVFNTGILISAAESSLEIAQIRELFTEYAESLGFSLCFQDFDRELAGLPGDYAPPHGRLLIARRGAESAGCIALHPFGHPFEQDGLEPICEMKRLYVRPQFRGSGLGRLLAERVIADAKSMGYRKMRLDTVEPKMKKAVALYRALGFREIGSYRPNPIEGAMYMELEL
ncbi:MAG: GNAT family N-acetyltransferase [Terriglobales bacterium]|jgi:ribosomal protein S18 acetylase RimI-like enzyme|nr:GNAT family N-acetyltransferase [Terriglobales bacterium]